MILNKEQELNDRIKDSIMIEEAKLKQLEIEKNGKWVRQDDKTMKFIKN